MNGFNTNGITRRELLPRLAKVAAAVAMTPKNNGEAARAAATTPEVETIMGAGGLLDLAPASGNIVVRGYAVPGDGGGGTFFWDPSAPLPAADGGTIFQSLVD